MKLFIVYSITNVCDVIHLCGHRRIISKHFLSHLLYIKVPNRSANLQYSLNKETLILTNIIHTTRILIANKRKYHRLAKYNYNTYQRYSFFKLFKNAHKVKMKTYLMKCIWTKTIEMYFRGLSLLKKCTRPSPIRLVQLDYLGWTTVLTRSLTIEYFNGLMCQLLRKIFYVDL